MSVVGRLKEINASPPPEESIALRISILIAIEAAVIAVLQQDVGSPLLRIVCIAGIPIGFAVSHAARHSDRFWLKLALAFGVLVAFGNFLAAIGSIGISGAANVQIPLAELFLWVQFLHSLDVPARRDLLFSLVSSLVLVAVAGVLSITLSFGTWLAIWACAAVVSLVLGYRRELAALPPLGPTHMDHRGDNREVRVVIRAASLVVALVLFLGVVVFRLVPAAGGARAFTFPARLPDSVAVPVPGGLSNPTLGRDDPSARGPNGQRGPAELGGRARFGYFGFSDRLDTSARGRPDNTLVMRVRASRPDFWRGQTFDTWDGRTWTVSRPRPVARIRGDAPFVMPVDVREYPFLGDSEFVQTYYVRNAGPNMVFAANVATEVYFEADSLSVLADGAIRAPVSVGDGGVYTVISRRPPSSEASLRLAPRVVVDALPPPVRRYAGEPVITDRVRNLALSVTAGLTNSYDMVRALEDWMGANTSYTLDIPRPPRGADAVDQFLFVDKKGFCEQIGSALVIMLRSLGIPARLAVGYAAGERNPFTGLFEVRASDAHSWAEVWFPGIGWQGFDPTAKVPLAGDQSFVSAGAGASKYISLHLPKLPKSTPLFGVGFIVLAGLLVGGRRFLADAAAKKAAAAAPWAERFTVRLETEGRARGRPRDPAETVREYASALATGVLPDPRLRSAASAVEIERFAGVAVPDHEREAAEAALTEAAATWPS